MSKSETSRRSTSKLDSDVAFVRALSELLSENDLAELEVTRDYGDGQELHVRLSRTAAGPPAPTFVAAPAAPLQAPPPALAPPPVDAQATIGAANAGDPLTDPNCVTSPMVGTVYLSPEPGVAAFVSVGDTVVEGQTLLIVEAMKTMNQIPSPRAGVVREVLVSDKQPVEFGAPLLIVS